MHYYTWILSGENPNVVKWFKPNGTIYPWCTKLWHEHEAKMRLRVLWFYNLAVIILLAFSFNCRIRNAELLAKEDKIFLTTLSAIDSMTQSCDLKLIWALFHVNPLGLMECNLKASITLLFLFYSQLIIIGEIKKAQEKRRKMSDSAEGRQGLV